MPDSQDDSSSQELVAYIIRHMTCAHCATPYASDDVVVALRDTSAQWYVATCPVCRAERTITVYDQMPWLHLGSTEPVVPAKITEATVNEWRAFLDMFDGDCYDLLAQV